MNLQILTRPEREKGRKEGKKGCRERGQEEERGKEREKARKKEKGTSVFFKEYYLSY